MEIQSPKAFSFNRYDYYSSFNKYNYNTYDYYDGENDEFDKKEIKANIISLKQERDYLLSVGEYIEAEGLDCEIDDLKNYYQEATKMNYI